jgi:hypothetical protein
MSRTLAGLLIVSVLFAQSAAAASVSVPVSEDAAISYNDGFPGVAASNFGIFQNLFAGSFDPDFRSESRSLMKFVLPSLPAGQTLQSATLRLVVGQEFPQTKQFDFLRVDDDWAEGSVTWLSAPQPTPFQLPIASFNSAIGLGPTPPRDVLLFDITPAVEAEQSSDPTQTLSILWKERDESGACCNRLAARSKELAGIPENVPQIILTFVPEPSTAGLLAVLVVVPLVRGRVFSATARRYS